jgi:hypothetical protein
MALFTLPITVVNQLKNLKPGVPYRPVVFIEY